MLNKQKTWRKKKAWLLHFFIDSIYIYSTSVHFETFFLGGGKGREVDESFNLKKKKSLSSKWKLFWLKFLFDLGIFGPLEMTELRLSWSEGVKPPMDLYCELPASCTLWNLFYDLKYCTVNRRYVTFSLFVCLPYTLIFEMYWKGHLYF